MQKCRLCKNIFPFRRGTRPFRWDARPGARWEPSGESRPGALSGPAPRARRPGLPGGDGGAIMEP